MSSAINTTPLAPVTVRPLAPEDYPRLASLPIAARGIPSAQHSVILVAETEAGEIVGVWGAFTMVMLDGLWVAPAYRQHSSVAARLLRGMKSLLAQLGIVHSFTLVDSPEVLLLALKAGFQKLPHDVCLLDLTHEGGGVSPCP